MKLSDTTIELLKNFALINTNMLFKPGNTISTISMAKNILAKAEIVETFPREFGIYDLNEFLSVLSLLKEPELEFGTDSLAISQGDAKITYYYASPATLTAPQKSLSMPKPEVVLKLSADVIAQIRRAASALGHSELAFAGSNGKVTIVICDPKNGTANRFSIVADSKNACTESFNFIMSIGSMKLFPGDYTLEISSKLISRFKCESAPIETFVALEKTSTFGKQN